MIKRIAVILISLLSGTICSSLAQPQIGTGFLAGAKAGTESLGDLGRDGAGGCYAVHR